MDVGAEKAVALFESTRRIEASGGMMVADGSRRRTPGGVFVALLRADPNVSSNTVSACGFA